MAWPFSGDAPRRRIVGTAALLQVGLLLVAPLAAFAPPPSGSMLAVPLTRTAAATIDQAVAQAGARVLGVGPWSDARFVSADRGLNFVPALSRGILLLPTAPRLCASPEAVAP